MSDENKFPATTSKWSDNIESILKNLGESCLGYKWMNMFAAKKNEFRYNTLMYISIILGPITGILSAINDSEVISVLQIFITVFSFMSGVISAVIKFSEFGEKSNLYKNIAAKYASLESNIKRQLNISREDRVKAGDYFDWISKSYDDLFSSSPLISDDIYQEWVKYTKENNLTIPKELGNANSKEINIPNSVTENHSVDVDLSKFSDGKMKYEVARMSRMK